MKKDKFIFIIFALMICSLLCFELIAQTNNKYKSDYINKNNDLKEMLYTTKRHVVNLINIMNDTSKFINPQKSFNDEKYYLGIDFFALEKYFDVYKANIPSWDDLPNMVSTTTKKLNENGYSKNTENLKLLNKLKAILDSL